ncbi:MAG: 16S rRNA (cytidine(1402)-2'-O)-methyltransferase [Acidimicrobiales bacterium]|nr:16S rRNA (cytidine(1402)-2'-O)-methyltransferase [Hyphomonadaceae bacterium]RZV41160.1 MAG: 16S rRNA (cytidine(1402)-2'-O)-methyltransferase [Acidimicrobiales bacterium]
MRQTTQSPSAFSPAPLTIKSEPLTAGLYLVATPIGNLRDITIRALDILASADHILAEDTRQSRKLLQAYDIDASLTAYHDHNAAKRVPKLVDTIKDGASIALISDAGTPLVSDPGYKLARAAIDADLDVFAIPGASAVLTGLVTSGLASDAFYFGGFLPPKSGARRTSIAELKNMRATMIFFESAGRLHATLTDLFSELGEREIVIARELTKKYEEIKRGYLSSLIDELKDTKLRGEIVLMVGSSTDAEKWDEATIDQALKDLIGDLGVKRASEEVANLSGHAKRDIYKRALQIKDV